MVGVSFYIKGLRCGGAQNGGPDYIWSGHLMEGHLVKGQMVCAEVDTHRTQSYSGGAGGATPTVQYLITTYL
jgi:hypothetical protein